MIWVHNSLKEVKIFRQTLFELVINQNSSNVKFDLRFFFIKLFELIIRCALRNENEPSEIGLSLSSEMRPGQRIASIFEDVLVELFVFLLLDFLLITHPKWFIFVDSLEFDGLNFSRSCSVNLILDLVFIELFSFSSPLFSDFLDLGLDFSFGFLNFLLSHNYFF